MTDATTAATALASLPTDAWQPPFGPEPYYAFDLAESQMYALQMAATDPCVGWRDGAAKILVWIGDNPGWEAGYDNDHYPAAYARTRDQALDALQAAGIIVEAISVGSSPTGGLDGSYDGSRLFGEDLGTTVIPVGQASHIAGGTGGDYYPSLGEITGEGLRQAILDAIEAGFEEYFSVGLDISEAIAAGLSIKYKQSALAWGAADNTPYTDDWERDADRVFLFDVEIQVPGAPADWDYIFKIYGTLDGGIIVEEPDWIRVGQGGDDPVGPEIPEPSTVALLGLGLLGVGIAARRKMRK
jgi:hypothetical protein